MWFPVKVAISAFLIAFSSWLADKRPELAGFIIALPITSMLVLAFSYAEFSNAENSVKFAKSIVVAVPLSLLFFVPFLFAKELKLNFWALYGLGVALLAIGYFLQSYIMRQIT